MLASARGPEAKLPDEEKMKARADEYRQAWLPYEKKVLAYMQELLGLRFYLPVIDVTIAPMMPAMSTPLIINLRPEPDEFVTTLIHELIHVLLSDNREEKQLQEVKERLAPGESLLVANHVLVHAVMEKVFLEALSEPERLQKDIDFCQGKLPAYSRAWSLVKELGADRVITDIRAAPVSHRGK